MMIAFPVERDGGLWSPVRQHFGRAQGFMVVDMKTENFRFLNSHEIRQAGECAPLGALSRLGVKEVLCRGMGRGALSRCRDLGIRVYQVGASTVTDGILERSAGHCPDLPDEALCDHHHHGHDEGHDHDGNCCNHG